MVWTVSTVVFHETADHTRRHNLAPRASDEIFVVPGALSPPSPSGTSPNSEDPPPSSPRDSRRGHLLDYRQGRSRARLSGRAKTSPPQVPKVENCLQPGRDHGSVIRHSRYDDNRRVDDYRRSNDDRRTEGVVVMTITVVTTITAGTTTRFVLKKSPPWRQPSP